MSAKTFFIILIAITIGAGLLYTLSHPSSYEASLTAANELTPIQTQESNNIPSTDSPSDSPMPLEKCDFGIAVRDLTPDVCKKAQDIINQDKTQDEEKVQQKIDIINTEILNLPINKPSNSQDAVNEGSIIKNAITETCHGDALQIDECRTSMLQSITSILQQTLLQQQATENQLINQRTFYENFLTNIEDGASGDGACSGHNGVDSASGRGEIGQVICNDGWIGSSVYYFNVVGNLDYFLNNLN